MIVSQERSYSGSRFRPRPIVKSFAGGEGLMIFHLWGVYAEMDRWIQKASDFLDSSESLEHTTLIGRAAGEIETIDRLRAAMGYLNEELLIEANKTEFSGMVETLLVHRSQDLVSWAQAGQPSLYLAEPGLIQPLAVQIDLDFQYGMVDPLPQKALGVDRQLSVQSGSLKVSKEASLLVLSRSKSFSPSLSEKDFDLQVFTKAMAAESPEIPFWIGRLQS